MGHPGWRQPSRRHAACSALELSCWSSFCVLSLTCRFGDSRHPFLSRTSRVHLRVGECSKGKEISHNFFQKSSALLDAGVRVVVMDAFVILRLGLVPGDIGMRVEFH